MSKTIHQLLLLVCALATPSVSFAQDPIYDVSGVKYGRGYFAPTSFEQVDTVTGGLMMSFTDLALPGNAGLNLTVSRTYNSREAKWRFGIGGAPMQFKFLSGSDLSDIDFITTDGGEHNAAGPANETFTIEFWRFNKTTMQLAMPNGIVATYGHVLPNVGGFVTQISDPFGNTIDLNWQPGTATLVSAVQNLGWGQTRTVTFGNWADDSPSSMTYNGKTWTYEWELVTLGATTFKALKTAMPAIPPRWEYWYADDGTGHLRLSQIRTPHGGMINYEWAAATFPTTPSTRIAVRKRITSWRAPGGEWLFDWLDNGGRLVITGPANRVTYRTVTINGEPLGSSREIATLAGDPLDTETVTYEMIPNPVAPLPAVKTRVVQRGNATYTTTFTYSASDFADYGQPITIQESGQLSRTTSITYRHNFTPYIRGRVASVTTTVGGQSFGKSFQYHSNSGFLEASTVNGTTTSFTDDGRGNVGSVRDPLNHVTSFAYDLGVVKNVNTPLWSMTSTLNPDGSAASVTRGNVTTTFGYNELGAVTSINTNTPGRLPVEISYITTNWILVGVTMTRGTTWVTTGFEGFGRSSGSNDVTGRNAGINYDGAGRVTFRDLPFDASTPYAQLTYQYDALNRLKSTGTPGVPGKHLEFWYGDTTVGISEQIANNVWRGTEQTFAAFGDPDDARLVSFRDQANNLWNYQYNAAGSLTSVSSNVAPTRTWTYDSRNLPASSTNPESGTTTTVFDSAGRLTYSEDARGPSFAVRYEYDDNNRLTKIDASGTDDDVRYSYDTLDRIVSIENGAGPTLGRISYVYDTAGRVTSRTDLVRGQTFVQTFEYDGMDRLVKHTYPVTGRQVTYTYDAASRVTSVKTRIGANPEITVASGFTYLASGAVKSYTLGNGQTKSVSFDIRQRPTHWVSGPLDITYQYDHASNVTAITDARPGQNATYSYDLLDRLTSVVGSMTMSYTYDGAGNRLTAGTISFNYDANSRLTSLSGGATGSFAYNAIGSTVSDPTGATYAYTGLNALKSATLAGQTTTYRYGADGFRSVKEPPADPATIYVRSGSSAVVSEFRALADEVAVQREYIYGAGELLASVASDTSSLRTLGISLLTPTTGQSFPQSTPFNFTSKVAVPAGATVARVEYYRDGLLIGSSTDAANGYPFPWNSTPVGLATYTFRARVVLTDGRAASSNSINVTIY